MGDFAAVVRRFMTLRKVSLRETARAAGYSDHTLVSKALNGHKAVTPYLAAALDEALDAGGEIVAAARSAQAVAEAAGLPLRELADHAAELGAWAETGTAGPGTTAALADEIDSVTGAYEATPAALLILRASDACRRVSALLRQHQRLRYQRDLFVIAARCCAFLAVALGDLGKRAEAGAYARTSLTLAEESADAGAVALALSALAKVAFWDGRKRASADFAARGHATAKAGDPLWVLLACQRADAAPLPMAGEILELTAAELGQHPPGSAGAGQFDCGAVRLAGYQATLGLREGSLAAVLAALAGAERAVDEGEDVPYASLAQVRLCAALAMLASGDADRAAGQLAPVLGLPAEMRLATFAGRLAQAAVLASAPPYRGSVVAGQIADEVAGYLGTEPPPFPHPLAIDAASVH